MQKHTRFLLSSLLCLSITGTAASGFAASNSRALQKIKQKLNVQSCSKN
jgi:hypothetical protein